MPCRGWKCNGKKVGFGHFDGCVEGLRGRPSASPFFARLAEIKIREDVRHQGLDLTATGVMDCPRRLYLERTHDYWIDPRKMAPMTRGTGLHMVMANVLDPEVWSTEANDPVRHALEGTLGGYPVGALVDAWRRDYSEIVDAKFPKDWSIKHRPKGALYRKGDPDKVSYCVQLNIERLLLGQQPWALAEGYDPEQVKLTIWDHGIGAEEGPLMIECEMMSEEEVLGARAWGAMTTVGDHMDLLTEIRARHEKLEPGDEDGRARLAAAIPLLGKPMWQGGMCPGCAVKERCDELVVMFGTPGE